MPHLKKALESIWMGVYQGTAGAVGMAFVSDDAQILVDIVDPGTSLVVLKPRC